MTHPERIVPDEVEPGVVALHLKRYEFAEPWCAGKDVLDAACGVGYGTAHLAGVARRVVGVDLDEAAVEYARERYGAPSAEFAVMDVAALDLPDASFDAVCSFETIEHVADRNGFLEEVVRVLRPAGVFLVSTPRADRTTEQPANPFHRVEFAPADFERLLRQHFEQVELHGQRRVRTTRHRVAQRLDVLGLRRRVPLARRVGAAVVGTAPTESLTAADVVIERGRLDDAGELVALCTGPRR